MRSHEKRHKVSLLPMILQLDVRPHEVQVFDSPEHYHPEPGFALFATAFNQLSGGGVKQVGVERPLYAHTDRRMVEARAKYHMARKMRRAYRRKEVVVQMKSE